MSNPSENPRRPINWVRIAVPLAMLAFGALFIASSLRSGKTGTTPAQPKPAVAAQPTTQPTTQPAAQPVPPTAGDAPSNTTPTATTAPASSDLLAGLRVQPLSAEDAAAPLTPIGSTEAAGTGEWMKLEFSPIGAGLKSLDLARYKIATTSKEHVRAQAEYELKQRVKDGERTWYLTPFAALTLELKPEGATSWVAADLTGFVTVPGSAPRLEPAWKQTAPGTFVATVINGRAEPIARVTRTYELKPGTYAISLRQRVENLTSTPLRSRWSQLAAVDLPKERGGYGLDMRRLRFGYQLPKPTQAGDPTVLSQAFLWGRTESSVLGSFDKAINNYPVEFEVWPNRKSQSQQLRLVWAAMTSRYFAVAAMPLIDGPAPDKVWEGVERITRLRLDNPSGGDRNPHELALKVTLADEPLPAKGSRDVSMRLYAGPLSKEAILADPVASTAGLDGLIVYNLGGFCGPCTFELLTGSLIGLLRVLHSYIVFDWALSIIVLVLCVRGILHPITRWSQIRIQRFGKQMSEVGPKQKKLQEKYASDPQKLREETAKLWREEGVNPAGMLGCLPMFLQTPVWIALYATLYFAFELRHSPAFFGIFQSLGGPSFTFLSDLAEPDHLIEFTKGYHVPLISTMMGDIWGVNVLPVILGIVFFMQQKYMTPPTTVTMTPEQEMQQKIVKYMMVFLFPVMMYNAPSGLAIYFISNSVLGIIESKWIRRHIEKNKLLEVKKPAPGEKAATKEGFMARLQRLAEERQKMMDQAKKMQNKRKP